MPRAHRAVHARIHALVRGRQGGLTVPILADYPFMDVLWSMIGSA